MEHHALKNVNNCFNANIYSYLETSCGQSSNIYLPQTLDQVGEACLAYYINIYVKNFALMLLFINIHTNITINGLNLIQRVPR